MKYIKEEKREFTGADKWKLLPAFLSARGLVKQHIDSYNYLVTRDIHQIVMAQSNKRLTSDVDPKWFAEYENVTIGAPSYMDGMTPKELTPQICRIRDMTYAAPIYVDVVYYKETEIVRKKGLKIGYIPVMLRSQICCLAGKTHSEMSSLGECPLDPGGYFIVKGTERVLLMQEQLSNNRIIVELDPSQLVQAVVTSSTADNKSRTVVCFRKQGREGLFVKHSAFADLVPLVTVMKAMGIEADQEIVQMIGMDVPHTNEGITLSLQDSHALGVFTQMQALEYLAGKLKQRPVFYKSTTISAQDSYDAKVGEVLDVLVRQLLSNIPVAGGPSSGSPLDLTNKAQFLCLMARRCLDATRDHRLLDDRDYYGNKRLELAGQLIGLLFEDMFKNLNQDIKSKTDKILTRYLQHKASSSATSRRMEPYPDAFAAVAENIITHGLQRAISSGNWNIKRFRIDRTGVSQVLSRFSYIAALGAMTRVKSQFEKSRKLAGPRALQPSQWGMLCPSDTPEGEQCGLVKHLCLMTHVTTPEDDASLRKLCFAFGVEDAGLVGGDELYRQTAVYLNGALLGVHKHASGFVKDLRTLRRSGKLGEFVSIYTHEALNAIFIASDGGRLCRPLIVVENGESRLDPKVHLAQLERGEMKFQDFLIQGIIEWVDVNEENDSLIAFREPDITVDHTHLEIEPLTLLGAVAGLIPYPHHNQSPRNTYQCAMGKQAMGAIAYNQFVRTDTLLLTLVYPQKPMVKSRTIDLIGWENLPAGHNASVAVMSYSGYDIEDAIVMNRASLDRGFGRCGYFKRTVTQLESRAGLIEQVRGPPPTLKEMGKGRGGPGNNPGLVRKYASVDADGLPRIGDFVHDGAIIINKVSPVVSDTNSHTVSASSWAENAVRYKNPVPSLIDRVIWTQDEAQVMSLKVITRQTRRPELGDKFSSRHGQKGVVGLIVPQQDMPFSETGWCPDLIMNPHGFPSRMTVGKMLELLAGKGGVLEGQQAYGTVFGGTPRDEVCKQLIKHGFNPSGKDILYSGITGEPLECYIFSGPIYYQKLKHMVVDKIHARSTGPRQGLTRQPTEGRARDGGLRLGEMERDCLVAYGASNLLLERLMLSSDVFSLPVCKKCGLIGQSGWCNACKSGKSLVTLRLPYACKLLFQELLGMNVCPRLKVEHR